MRRSIIAMAFAAAAGITAFSGTASAQGVEFYAEPSYDYDYRPYRGYYYAPPAYGYSNGGGYFERPERYRYGTRRWWRQMDRTGRGGHQD